MVNNHKVTTIPVKQPEPKFPVMEIFGPTIQGEGALIGMPTHFVRLGGCTYRCAWCIAENSRVLMSDWTTKPIQEVKVGDFVLGMKQQISDRRYLIPTEVLEVHDNGIKDTVSVTTETNQLICTEDHLIHNLKHKPKWDKAKLLANGGKIKSVPLGTRNAQWRRGWLAGYLKGDGCFHKYKDRWWRVKVTSIDDLLLDTAKSYAEELGVALRSIVHNAGKNAYKSDNKIKGLECTQNDEVLKLKLQLYTAKDTNDPDTNYSAGWLAGIFDAEGTLDKTAVRITQLKEDVRADIVTFASSLGFEVNEQKRCIILTPSVKFYSQCRPILQRKIPLQIGLRCMPSELVKSVTPNDDCSHVYDLTTACGSYTAEGILVHNCDTMFAVDPQQVKEGRVMMTPSEILSALEDLGPNAVQWVTISGGDPMMHKHLNVLVDELRDACWNVAIETQGAILHDNGLHCDHLTISPKPPSSGMKTDMEVLTQYIQAADSEQIADSFCVKIVVFDEEDLRWANNIACKMQLEELYLQVGTQQEELSLTGYRNQLLEDYNWLVNEVLIDEAPRAVYKYPKLQDMHSLILLPQMHALVWHNERGK